ncbi:MAG: hypothetical protein AAGI38_01155 [Bacteroidota bacterium]
MKIRLSKTPSRAIIITYILLTLGFRFYVEPQLNGVVWISVALGIFGLLFLWAMIRSGVLNPDWFSFEKKAES